MRIIIEDAEDSEVEFEYTEIADQMCLTITKEGQAMQVPLSHFGLRKFIHALKCLADQYAGSVP